MGIYISIGSNIGEKESNIKRSINLLRESDGINSVAVSELYKTSPVDYTDQDWFVNCAVEIETDLSPENLLICIQNIEEKMGRKRDIRFGPRIIDLDIIFFDNIIKETEDLILPHPRMHERLFVLKPISDLNKDAIHPVFKKSINELVNDLNSDNQEIQKL